MGRHRVADFDSKSTETNVRLFISIESDLINEVDGFKPGLNMNSIDIDLATDLINKLFACIGSNMSMVSEETVIESVDVKNGKVKK